MKKTKALFSVFLSTSLLFGCSQNTGNESQSKDKDSEREKLLRRPADWMV